MSRRPVFALVVIALLMLGSTAGKTDCTPGELVAPQIEKLQSGTLFDHPTDSLEWSWSDLPEGQLYFGDLPVEFPPATPVPGDECSTFTNEFDCMAVAGCNWYFVVGAPDFCAKE